MISRRNTVVGAVVALVMSAALAAPAYADSPPPTINGWSESQFVAAAVQNGTDAATATRSWGDKAAMSQIVVKSTLTGGIDQAPSVGTKALAAAATGSASAWCSKQSTNVFGAVLIQLKVVQNYSYSGTTVTSWNTQVFPDSSLGWYFNGVILSQDFFSTGSGNPQGHHSSYRMAKFTNDFPSPYNANMWVQTTVYAPAGYECASGGGV